MYYNLLVFLAGISAKLYDDLKDNVNLINFRSKYILEILKLFHMGAFITASFYNPLYCYIILIIVLFNIIGDPFCYKFVYERCLFIAILCFLPFFDNSKIKIPSLSDISPILLFIFILCIGAYIEATIIKEEYSYRKLISRIIGIIWSIFMYFYFLSIYELISFIQMYLCGYLFISILVQFYCLFIYDPVSLPISEKKNNKKKHKKQCIKRKNVKNNNH